MAIKHVKDYYNQLIEQQEEMTENLRDFEEAAEKGLIEPEKLEQLKTQTDLITTNLQRISYIIFLLNMPIRKSKHQSYLKMNSKKISKIQEKDKLTGIKEENRNALNNIKNLKG